MAKVKYVWVMTMDLVRFQWTALGHTKDDCVNAMKRRWRLQAEKSNGGDQDWETFTKRTGMSPADVYTTTYRRLRVGKAYRSDETE